MSYSAGSIIKINTRITPQGLAFANFGKAILFAPESELPNSGFDVNTYKTYNSMVEVGHDFDSNSETYKAAAKFLGGIPATYELMIWGVDSKNGNITDTLNKAYDQVWFFWMLFTKDIYADLQNVDEIAQWADNNGAMFINNQSGASAAAIRLNAGGDVASALTTAGYRNTFTFCHATDDYAGNALAKHFAAVNYSAENSTITGEFKKLPSVAAEDLTSSEYNAMKDPTKKAVFYTVVDLQGSKDNGRVINSVTHSSYGEYIDDVVNLHAFVNYLKVSLFNVIANSVSKVGQDPIGQSLLIGKAKQVCEQFIANNYLGARNYTDPDDGIEKYTVGYEVLTKPEDILNLSDADRADRKAYPINLRVFRKGAIHAVDITVDVY